MAGAVPVRYQHDRLASHHAGLCGLRRRGDPAAGGHLSTAPAGRRGARQHVWRAARRRAGARSAAKSGTRGTGVRDVLLLRDDVDADVAHGGLLQRHRHRTDAGSRDAVRAAGIGVLRPSVLGLAGRPHRRTAHHTVGIGGAGRGDDGLPADPGRDRAVHHLGGIRLWIWRPDPGLRAGGARTVPGSPRRAGASPQCCFPARSAWRPAAGWPA